MSRSTLVAVAALMLGSPAVAQVLQGPQWTTSGFIGVGAVERGAGSAKALFLGDADVAYSFGQVSAELSIMMIHGPDYFANDTHIMGGVGYNFGNGSVLYAGAPRSAYDRFGRFEVGQTSRYLSLLIAVTDKSPFSNVSNRGPKREGYGLRFDSDRDADMAFSASILQDSDEEATAAGASGQYRMGATTLAGGLEFISDDSGDSTQAKFMAETRFDLWAFGGGLSYYENETALRQAYGEVSVVYSPTDHVDLSAFAAKIDDNLGAGGLETYGLGARYNFGNGGDISASLSNFDEDRVLEFSASLHF